MNILTYLLPDSDVMVFDEISVVPTDNMIICATSMTPTTAVCPSCQQVSARIHSRYMRVLGDLPWAGLAVQIGLHVRRFRCDNTDCPQKIFCERIPTVAAPWARRTQRLADAQQAIGLATGGVGGARLCTALAMDAGTDLLLGLIRSLQISDRPTPRVLGVDDWAKRKGHSYGTILVDLERGEVVDILPDRTSESLEQWLKAHPGVEIISRDRAGAYAEGARQGAPDAVQVADRWHLLKNLADAVYKALQQHQSAIERALVQDQSKGEEPTAASETESLSPASIDETRPSAADIARQQRVEKTHELHERGWTQKAIALHLGLCPKTVRRYLKRDLTLTPSRRSRRGSCLDSYKPYILDRWNMGCHTAAQLFGEIQQQGYLGQVTLVRDFVSQLRRASGLPPGKRNASGKPVTTDPSKRPPTVRSLAFLIMRPPAKLDEEETEALNCLIQVHPHVQTTVDLARAFATMVRQRQVEDLDGWLNKATVSQVPALRSFASGLRQDESAVRAALCLPWSNGPTEGHINRLKCLKRQMYGRAKLDLLRQRLMAS